MPAGVARIGHTLKCMASGAVFVMVGPDVMLIRLYNCQVSGADEESGQMALLDRDFHTTLLAQLVAATSHVSIASRETRTTLGNRSTRLTGRQSRASRLIVVIVVSAESAMSTNGSRNGLSVPGHHATEASGISSVARVVQIHAAQSVDKHRFVTAGTHGSIGGGQGGAGLAVLTGVLGKS